jgi:hypothetical protein
VAGVLGLFSSSIAIQPQSKKSTSVCVNLLFFTVPTPKTSRVITQVTHKHIQYRLKVEDTLKLAATVSALVSSSPMELRPKIATQLGPTLLCSAYCTWCSTRVCVQDCANDWSLS